jgi:hypothetical protein
MTTQTAPTRSAARTWSPAQRFAVVFGVVYLAVAVAGFALTGFSVSGHHAHTLVIFAVNPLHNYIHLFLGVLWLVSVPKHSTARLANLVIGVVLGLVTVLGFFGGMGMLGMSGLADPDNFLHLATASLALYFGSVAARSSEDSAAH